MELSLQGVSFAYGKAGRRRRTPAEFALRSVDLTAGAGEFVALAGRSGSGKSTLTQILKGLLVPTSGRLLVDGIDPVATRRPELYDQIGLVFQYPEHQLFAATVFDDVAFGPRQQQQDAGTVAAQVAWALESVGLPPAQFGERSPFELSGGEKRRAAIAGVLALRPRALILDEPTAGMDLAARRGLFDLLHRLNREGVTVFVVSHDLEEVARHASRLVVLDRGQVAGDGAPLTLLTDRLFLERCGLEAPESLAVYMRLRELGFPAIDRPWDPDAVARALMACRQTGVLA
jgi:energy-coupling factor transport system ATP-binding protein